MAQTVKVTGAKELERGFRQMRKQVLRELRPELRKAGELVRTEASTLFSSIDARSAAGYKVRVRAKGVAVEQSLRKVTGLRGDYGALQMRRALIPALEAKGGEASEMVTALVNRASLEAGL